MPNLAYVEETKWLQEVVRCSFCDILYSPDAGSGMANAGLEWPDITFALREARVTHCEKADLGWRWLVDGEDVDGGSLAMVLEVESNTLRIEILEVRRGSWRS